jgi:hypothetical protein
MWKLQNSMDSLVQTPQLDRPKAEDITQARRETLDELGLPLFAVIDGGLFADLPNALNAASIPAQSLFRTGGEPDFQRAGPWLVNASDEPVRQHVEKLDEEKPCVVFWSCTNEQDLLWRHLRSINEVLIPLEGPDAAALDAPKYERVLFRHWDPNVLGSILPIFTRPQIARVLGPANAVVMHAPDYGGLKRARRPADLPPMPPGPLRIEPDQMEKLKTAMIHSSRLRIARFLRSNIPPEFSGVDDEFVWRATLHSEKSADELGIRTEQGRARWTYLMTMSDGKAASFPEVRNYVRDGDDTPDNRVKSLIQHAADALRRGHSANGATV